MRFGNVTRCRRGDIPLPIYMYIHTGCPSQGPFEAREADRTFALRAVESVGVFASSITAGAPRAKRARLLGSGGLRLSGL